MYSGLFSVGCYAFDAGAVRIIATATVDAAFQLKKEYTNSVLVGEREEKKIEGFDFGNSPTEIIKTDLHGKNGLFILPPQVQRGLLMQVNADMVYYRQHC